VFDLAMKNVIFDVPFFQRALNPNNVPIGLIIMGLGNPAQYQYTRHNAGKYVCSRVQEYMKLGPYKEFTTEPATIRMYRDHPGLLFAEPNTYMNVSSLAVEETNRWFSYNLMHLFPHSKFFLVHDDLELGSGKMSYRFQCRSTKGHNGLKSIVELTHGTVKFPRLRLGIGRPTTRDRDTVAAYVLAPFSAEEKNVLDNDIVPMFADILDVILQGDLILPKDPHSVQAWTKIFNQLNGKLVGNELEVHKKQDWRQKQWYLANKSTEATNI
jgi:PTH1 family peptidyl-tRNA hydrolase